MSLSGNITTKTKIAGSLTLPELLQGKSAYEVALLNGFTGTEAEWLESLKGKDGKDGGKGEKGDTGDSAYDVAVRNGFEGTEEEWLASLGVGVFSGFIEDLTPEEVSEALQKGSLVELHSREYGGVIWTSFELTSNGHFYSTAVGSTNEGAGNKVWFVAQLMGFVNFGMPFQVDTVTIPTNKHINELIDAKINNLSKWEGGDY